MSDPIRVTLGSVRQAWRDQDRRYNDYRTRIDKANAGESVIIPDDLLEYGKATDKKVEEDYRRLLGRSPESQ